LEQEKTRQQIIHEKGFNIVNNVNREIYNSNTPVEYNKIRVGVKTLDDAVLNLGAIKQVNSIYGNKYEVLRALGEKDIEKLREISNYFYRTNGIYSSVCHYFAFLYRYDWYVVPEVLDEKSKNEKILKEFNDLLSFFDNSYIEKMCGDLALEVIKNGAYYGYLVDSDDCVMLQQLPINYCRSRYNIRNKPAIEFNMRFFDDNFADINYRMRVLKMFPKEFAKGYLLYKQNKLPRDFIGDEYCSWYLLDPEKTVKFNFTADDMPYFVNAIPSLLDLDAAQDLDRRKQMQQLLKILIQKLPMDKNGDLIFDNDEARDIHNNAVQMLSRAIGVDVLTTFADIQVEDMADSNTTTKTDDLEKVERSVFNSFGLSRNLFNTDGNLALDKSILNDESSLRNLLLQFNIFFNDIAQKRSKNKKKYNFKLYMLETTQYNYKELAKMYKEQVTLGYSKMLPQIALGHSQSSIIHTAHFENEILQLSSIMIPPLMSSTISGEDILGKDKQSNSSNKQNKIDTKEKTAGRPEKADDQKSEKTIQNKESMN
jgi:hypothetical protein